MSTRPAVGTIAWRDLTVENAEKVRDFYVKVAGWRFEPVDMGGYSDFNMFAPGADNPVAGICFQRGQNMDLPSQWLMYIVVENLEAAARLCTDLGGQMVTAPSGMGPGKFCVIRDPAGAVCALYQPDA
jgi:hypothetical protein